MNDHLKKLALIGAVVAFASPLGGCLQGLESAVTDVVGNEAQELFADVDAAQTAGENTFTSMTGDWIEAKTNCAGTYNPASQTCEP
jgi:hypothetical protein